LQGFSDYFPVGKHFCTTSSLVIGVAFGLRLLRTVFFAFTETEGIKIIYCNLQKITAAAVYKL
jgi:hypothetical protein